MLAEKVSLNPVAAFFAAIGFHDVLFVASFACIVYGVHLLSDPAAWIVAGAGGAYAAVMIGQANSGKAQQPAQPVRRVS